MLRASLRFLLALTALSLLPGMQAFPANITPEHPPSAVPDTPRVASHGMGAEPTSLLGRHYTLAAKRDLILTGQALQGLPGTKPKAKTYKAVNTNTNTKTGKKTTMTKDTRPTPQPVPRDFSPLEDRSQDDLKLGDGVEKRESGDVNYVSDVGPAAVPASSSTPVPAPPGPAPLPPPPAHQPQYKNFPTPPSASQPAAPKDSKKGQSKSKGKEKEKEKTKDDKKKS